jgi:hypothetical protein
MTKIIEGSPADEPRALAARRTCRFDGEAMIDAATELFLQ